MFCRNCGTPIDELDNFCPKCGKEIVRSTSPPEKIDTSIEKISNEKISNEKISNEKISNEKISNEKISNDFKSYPLFKNGGVSAILSTFIPGLGQIYNGQIAKGIPIITISMMLIIFMIFMRLPERIAVYGAYYLLWIIGIFDARRSADKINSKFK